MRPPTVVIKATFIPPATTLGEISPAAWIASNALIIPITVPRNPREGAMAMKSEIQERPLSISLI